ncbi:MAG TPA: PAS domain-containing protein [Candidatus Eisenbacteria bacterium]|nr:PAS domain-containing protein [Candidatus Eisenbacteria bacterium]
MAAVTPEPTAPTPDDAALFGRVRAALEKEAPRESAAACLELIAELTAAASGGLFLERDGETKEEFWYGPHPTEVEERLRAAARAWLGTGGKEPGDPDLCLIPASADGRAMGLFCLAPPRGTSCASPSVDIARAIADLFAARVHARRESDHASSELERYERWFKTLDSHLQVLDRERQKFLAVVNQTDTYVFVAGPSGEVRWTNKAMAASTETRARDGLSCRDACSRFTGDEGGCGACAVQRAIKGAAAAHQELRKEQGGIFRNYYLTALPILAPDGKPQEALVLVQDLSDLSVLRESESRYRLLFDRSTNALLMIDPGSKRILLANAMACRFLGYSKEEFEGLALGQLHESADWGESLSRYAKALAGDTRDPFECVLLAKDGRPRWARAHASRVDLGGRDVGLVEFRDLTDRKRMETALRVSEERLATVVANAPIVLFTTNREGVVTLCQGKGLSAIGRFPGESEGKSVYELYADNPVFLSQLRRALAGESFTDRVAIGPVTFDIQYTPLTDETGAVTGTVGVALDVSQHRRLEEQLRQSQRMEAIGRLAGGVAHDFNNLLTVILGQSDLILLQAATGSPLSKNAEQIRGAAERGGWLARQLLAFGRKDAPASEPIDLNSVVETIEPMLRRLIGEDIELHTTRAAKPAVVRADRGHLDQVILNLALNARDAMPSGGRLRVEVVLGDVTSPWMQGRDAAVHAGPLALLTVSDTGFGMDAETLGHLFEPFFTTKERGKGTGLGLSIVYGIVDQCGGSVWVESERNRGTTVFVCLPIAGNESPAGSPESEAIAAPGSESVLLVEDEDPVRELVQEMLEMAGYRVHAEASGPDAIAWAEDPAHSFDLLVSDVVMPRMNGGELAERLRHLRPQTRVLFVSGYPDDAIVRHGVRESGAPFLQKPFTYQTLTEKVREVLDSPVRRAA